MMMFTSFQLNKSSIVNEKQDQKTKSSWCFLTLTARFLKVCSAVSNWEIRYSKKSWQNRHEHQKTQKSEHLVRVAYHRFWKLCLLEFLLMTVGLVRVSHQTLQMFLLMSCVGKSWPLGTVLIEIIEKLGINQEFQNLGGGRPTVLPEPIRLVLKEGALSRVGPTPLSCKPSKIFPLDFAAGSILLFAAAEQWLA